MQYIENKSWRMNCMWCCFEESKYVFVNFFAISLELYNELTAVKDWLLTHFPRLLINKYDHHIFVID